MKKFFNRLGSEIKHFFSVVALGVFTVSAFADSPTTVKDLASSVDFVDVGIAILAISGSVVAIYVIWKGAQFVIRQVRGA